MYLLYYVNCLVLYVDLYANGLLILLTQELQDLLPYDSCLLDLLNYASCLLDLLKYASCLLDLL